MLNSSKNNLKSNLRLYAVKYGFREDSTEFVILAAYLLKIYRMKEKENKPISYFDLVNYINNVDENIGRMILKFFNEKIWNEIKEIDVNDNEINDAILSRNESDTKSNANFATPLSIAKLASIILSGENVTVANMCSGYGDFLNEYISISKNRSSNKYYGIELNENAYIISKIRNMVLSEEYGVNIQYSQGDALEVHLPKIDKIFADPPFGRTTHLPFDSSLNNSLNITKMTSSVWLYILKGLESLNEQGVLIAVAATGSATNYGDMAIRQELVNSGFLKTVIELPKNLYTSMSISTVMYIFSKNRDLSPVRMINASDFYKKERRINILSDENIKCILNLMHQDDKNSSILVSRETIAEKEYTLLPYRYIQFESLPKFKNEKRLSDLVDIVRGAGYSANHLDEITSLDKETDIKFLTIKNINDGMIDDDLPYLKTFNSKDEKSLVNNNDIVMNKMGFPIKFAVADFKNDKKVLANSNLYILKIRDQSVDPYYLQALFESEYGTILIKGILNGAVAATISLKEFKELMIPVPEMAQQKKIGEEYKSLLNEIKIYKQKREKAAKKLATVFESEMKFDA